MKSQFVYLVVQTDDHQAGSSIRAFSTYSKAKKDANSLINKYIERGLDITEYNELPNYSYYIFNNGECIEIFLRTTD